MRAFIVRPFGTKEGINFDEVDKKLISPALDALEIRGRTTGEIVQQGNIRTDMFHQLLTANLVIADLSIHNANVFYELGLRHAFQDRHTFLIKSSGHDVPFDVKTDRYFHYDRENPENSLDDLRQALAATLRLEDADSPVFQLLPGLKAQARASFVKVPIDFREEVELAEKGKWAGDLALLAEEATRFGQDWIEEGLRIVGEAQFNIKQMRDARDTWEKVREYDGDDLMANGRLGTIYQKLGDLHHSDAAIKRALAASDATPGDLAELFALRGSNAKTRWLADWQAKPAEDRREAALASVFLDRAVEAYDNGFRHDLNHYYSGLNALAMATVKVELAKAMPEVWSDGFESDEEAAAALAKRRKERARLAAAVELSLGAARHKLARAGGDDPWLDVSFADFACLTSTRPTRVKRLYGKATARIPSFHLGSVARQLEIYRDLGVISENAAAALEVIKGDGPEPGVAQGKSDDPARVLVFTGHRVDAPGRESKRFPLAAEGKARQMIHAAIDAEVAGAGGKVLGCAGGASGGDILFHEECAKLGVDTFLFLAGPREQFVPASVADSEGDWVARFDALHQRLEARTRILSRNLELPRWLQGAGYSIWERNNLWELLNAMSWGAAKTTLIALWDGKGGDGPGGTQDMVERARKRGARTIILDAGQLAR